MGEFNSYSAAPQRVRTAVSRFHELGVKLPKAVTDAYATMVRLESPLQQPPRRALRDALIGGADLAGLQDIALADITAQPIETARLAARNHAAMLALDAVEASADQIHGQLAKLAQGAISKLKAAADVGDVPLDRLLRDGRAEDAQFIAVAEVTASELDRLYTLRDRLLWGKTRPVRDVSRWTDDRYAGSTFIDSLRRGGELWFPTKDQAMRRAAEIAQADDVGYHPDEGAA
jgi:hypothetical protein